MWNKSQSNLVRKKNMKEFIGLKMDMVSHQNYNFVSIENFNHILFKLKGIQVRA